MTKHLELDIMNVDKFVKTNDLEEITNPIYFVRDGVPTPDGLLSNEIFGISMDDRANRFAYIDLSAKFLHPYLYKQWVSMDRRIRDIVHGTKYYKIVNGDFVEDENGETGLNFIIKNLDTIKFRQTDSRKRDVKIELLNKAIKDKSMVLSKCTVIPAYYRDVNTSRGYIGVGEINKLYDSLLVAVRGLRDSLDYGLNISDASKGRIQEILVEIYNWFCRGTKDSGAGLSNKTGIVRRSVLSKTADYASRLVLSAPELKAEYVEDLEVDLDYSGVPLSSLCSNLYPYMVFYIRRFFENEFSGTGDYPCLDKNKNLKFVKIDNPMIQFSDTRIKHELDRYIKGFSNRFIPIEMKTTEGKTLYMKFKGKSVDTNSINKDNIKDAGMLINRRMTWCDLFYMAAVECSKGKHAIITRYPLDNVYGQFPTKIRVLSTKETEPVYIDNTLYERYPKIREEYIGMDTSSVFKDTLNICNCYLKAIGGDYELDHHCSPHESVNSNYKPL